MSDPTTHPPPPANFLFLVESILMQAQMQLGLLQFAELEGEDEGPDLPMARHSIDLLAMLQEKTRGNLTVEEQRLLENGLTELRFRYVQIAEKAMGEAAGAASSSILTSPGPLASELPKSELPKDDDRPRIISSGGGKGSKSE